jgi:hypothetical protein
MKLFHSLLNPLRSGEPFAWVLLDASNVVSE